MKTVIALLVAVSVFLPSMVKADKVDAVAAASTPAAPVEVGNKMCPVSGHQVGTMGDIVKVEHNGKIYNLCCGMCQKDFTKDADKYAKMAEDEVKAETEAKN